ncbi:hypothetical protein FRC10_001098 [Ceratobasidium sp. 414]|nr:hypothetical protein FRC10_001098 [Ceratobasidium sp. 414]
MSEYPMARRDTRVRFSFDHGSPQAGGNHLENDSEYPRSSSFPILEPQPIHSPRTHDSQFTHSRRATWAQPGQFSPPQGYIQNPNFDRYWGRVRDGADYVQSARPVPPGGRFDLENTSDVGPLDPSPIHPGYVGGRDRGYVPDTRTPVERPPLNPLVNGSPRQSDETLRNDDFEPEQFSKSPDTPKDGYFSPIPGYPAPPQTALRHGIRRSYSEDLSAPTAARGGSGSALEAGPGGYREQKGTFSKLMHTYGLSRGERQVSQGTISTGVDSRYQSQAVSRANSNESGNAILRMRRTRRVDSTLSLGGDALLDDDDPRITGAKPNRIDDENKARETFKQSLKLDKKMKGPCIVLNVNTVPDRQRFILRLAKALMTHGAPSHRIESQLIAAARVLEIDASFVHLPSIIIASFGDAASHQSETHFVKSGGGLDLGKLHMTHAIYRKVVHDEIGAKDGTIELAKLMRQRPIYGLRIRCILALLCSAIICPVGFGGSFVDMWISGVAGMVLCWLQLYAASKSALYSNVFDSLELASKNLISGSVKMVYAIVYSLFLGFSLTIGSDLYFLVDASARRRREQATQAFDSQTVIHGTFKSDNTSIFPFDGTFVFKNLTAGLPSSSYYQAKGCYRDSNWPWYLHTFPEWTLFFLVPLFSFFGSLASMQPLRSIQLPVMVFISCAAYAANKAANRYIFDRSDVVSAIGAFVVGVLGNLYSRVFRGTAFVVMVNGIGFLIPSGIAAAGGLAQNYRGSDSDQYSSGLSLGFRMVQVAIGITVGLFGSGLIVYSFGSRKRGALFAF